MKWDYHVKVEVDTNDADYINNDYHFGTYDDEDEASMKSLAVEVLVYDRFAVEDGDNIFYVANFLSDLKKFGLKPSDRKEEWKKYDCLLDYDSEAFEDLNDYEDDDSEDDEDENEAADKVNEEAIGDVPEKIMALAAALQHEVEDEIGDCLPWMDNCWNNHSFSYELTRRPAGVKEENCAVNYSAESYKDLIKYEPLYRNDNDDDLFDETNSELENA